MMSALSDIFFRGLIIGFSIAAPVGPIGILCIRRTIISGRLIGFISGFGAATADACYGLIAGFGITIISSFLIGQQVLLGLLGGIFLCYLGIKTLSAKPNASQAIMDGHPVNKSGQGIKDLIGAYFSTFLLTLTNPLTILSFAAIFAALGLTEQDQETWSAIALVFGVLIGSTAWWILLSFSTDFVNKRFLRLQVQQNPSVTTPQASDTGRYFSIFMWINRISGALITAFGIAALYRSIILL